MRDFPITPTYSLPVSAKYDLLDSIYDSVRYWAYFDYSGSFAGGDYSNFDSVTKIFKYNPEQDSYLNVSDEKIVAEWACRKKLAKEIQDIRNQGKQHVFDVEFTATMRFLPGASSSDIIDGQRVWKSAGTAEVVAPMSACVIDDEDILAIGCAIGADKFVEAYFDYIEHYS